ncbi:MAG: type IV toxin-antitoxin system AbiEi family antitoxin [Terriglobia bacterium]|jgi:hypothetical protein
MTEREILQALKNNEPFKGLPNVRVANVVLQPGGTPSKFDAKFDLQFGGTSVEVYAEIKNTCTPKQVEQIGPWLSRLKAAQKGVAFALVCPGISPQSQRLCFESNVDFIDLAGNVSINVPGKLLLQRVGMEPRKESSPSFYRNPFSGKSSRIVRVLLEKPRALLQKPREWTLSEIVKELATQSQETQYAGVSFQVSFALASRVLRSLEEELLVMRRNSSILVPEPQRLLSKWAQEYKDHYRRYLRRSFTVPNPFGAHLETVQHDLDTVHNLKDCYAFTGAAASSLAAPFVDVDTIDLYVSDEARGENLRKSVSPKTSVGPELRVIYPFDAGVFLYSHRTGRIPVVSYIQTYLDLFARGGRDLKQADHLLQSRIEPMWRRE